MVTSAPQHHPEDRYGCNANGCYLLPFGMRHKYALESNRPRRTDQCRSMGNRINPLFGSKSIELVCERSVVFVGSSSIRFWDLNAWFPGKTYLNRGFDGSQISDSIANIDLLVVKHQPRIVVFYAGDNDIAAGKTAERVASDFVALAKRVHATLTQTKILFIAIKPSIARWNLYSRMTAANELISNACNVDGRLTYIDVATPMIGQEGMPNPDLFVSDGLHLSASGYGLWTQLVKPYLD